MEEVKKVKRENRKRKKVIEAYQEMMNAGATGLHTVSNGHSILTQHYNQLRMRYLT